mgnify:CR=1 FL=1
MATTGQATGRYHVIPTTPTGGATGHYTVVPVGASDAISAGTVQKHINVPTIGRIAGTGRFTGRYRVLERRTVTTTLVAIKDAFVWDKEPTLNYGDTQDMAAGRSGGFLARGLLQFDVSSLRTDLTIVSAILRLRSRFVGIGEIGVHACLGPWDEYGVTWANQPPVAPTPEVVATVPGQVGETADLDITPLFLNWYQRTRANHGIGIRVTDELAMAATLWGAREAGSAWQPQLLVTYYEPEALADASETMSTGVVVGHQDRYIPALGYVSDEPEGTYKQDPCGTGSVVVWEGSVEDLVQTPYVPPDIAPLLKQQALLPIVFSGGRELQWALHLYRSLEDGAPVYYLGYPVYVPSTIVGPGGASDLFGVGISTPQYHYLFQAFLLWRGEPGSSPADSPFLGAPSTLTHWYGHVSFGRFEPYYALTWYIHAYVHLRSGQLPCFLPARGRVARPSLVNQGVARQISGLLATGYAVGFQASSLVSVGAPSRPDTPSTGLPRLAASSVLPSTGVPRVVGQSDLSAGGQAELGPNSLPTGGTVASTDDLPSTGDVGHAPNQVPSVGLVTPFEDLPASGYVEGAANERPSQGRVRVDGMADIPSRAHASGPWMASTGLAREHGHLPGRGRVRVGSVLPSAGRVTFRGQEDIPSSGWPRVRGVSELPSTGIARGGHADLISRGIVEAVVLELHVDLSAWPPEGRSPFPGS